MYLSSDNFSLVSIAESDLAPLSPSGFSYRNDKMQKINRPLNLFPIDLLLISIDNRQRVTCKYFKINILKIEKK